ncbi:Demethylsterigmatocystin 6-O-methyltransferase [Cytospora mali]|uniref:Demethylsterigmatocystin 6-O-methyltransferase n=1 Tax=Cytospora mali TaxID=578113 RepID=A0A194UNL6_CYTMA|nr:Demethylsterigmatocystin 6-O-methyltransferase [Valsa mali var. pyri (nom. inval.)]
MAAPVPKDEIDALLKGVNAAAEALDFGDASKAAEGRRALLLEAKKLAAALEDPHAEVWPRAFQVNVGISIDVAWDLGVWDKLGKQDSVALAEIVEETGADGIVIMDVSDHRGPGYALTSLGEPYLDPNHRSCNRMLLQTVVSNIRQVVEHMFTRSTGSVPSPKEVWSSLAQSPERARDMAQGMRSLSTGSLAPTAFPFGEELEKLDIREDEIAIVDIAGGQGHIMMDVRHRYPKLKGRIIVQDLPEVLDTVTDGPPKGIEFMPYNIFTLQPIRNAHVYYMRHIIHDWDDESVSVILRQLMPILKERPGTKLLLADLMLSEMNTGMQEAIRDFTMFPIGGMERTESQWRKLLARNGLEIKKIWRGTEPEACIECTLAKRPYQDTAAVFGRARIS